MTTLRDYQQKIYLQARSVLENNKSVAIQLHTGGGKTVIFTAMCESVYKKNKRAWIIVPRKELIRQSSAHLRKWGVPHGLISAGMQESKAFKIHVCSKDSLIRRYDKIKNYPDLVIIDECHLFIDRQKEMISHFPDTTKIIGYSATVERLDGKGLSTKSGGVYDNLIEGPSIPWLTERGFLSPLRYFAPPIDGLDNLKRRGTEYDENDLEELLKRKKIYGKVVLHYEKHGKDRAALIFCRSVKSAHQTAELFTNRGHNFVAIDGTMSDGKVKQILDDHRSGKITGICNCLLVTYGVDIERVEYIGDISPTLSRVMYMQKIGRGLRPFTDPVTGYVKKDLIYMDHVNQILEHQEDAFPGIPLHYVPEIKWNFHGTEKRKRKTPDGNPVLCPHLDFMYCPRPHCGTCSHNPDKSVQDARRPMIIVPAELQEAPKPKPMNERPPEERRELQDQIGAAVMEYKITPGPGPIEILLRIAESLGYREMWVYWRLTDDDRLTVNVPLLHEIARVKGYKPGWVFFTMKKIRTRTAEKSEYERVMT